MATKCFFLNAKEATGNGYGRIEGEPQTKINGVASDYYIGNHLRAATPGGGALSWTASSVTGPTNGIEPAQVQEWVSPPVDQDFTMSGSITVNLWGLESSMNANAALQIEVEKIDGATGAHTTVGFGGASAELGTAAAVQNFTFTPTSTAFKKGDRIRVVPFWDDAPATTMAAGFTLTYTIGGPTAGANGDSYITFAETFGFQTADPSGTPLYLRDTASAVNVGAGTNEREASLTQGSTNSDKAVLTATIGPISPIQFKDTQAGSSSDPLVEWYSNPLEAVTLNGVVKGEVYVYNSDVVSQSMGLRVQIAVCDGDGSGAVAWGLNTVHCLAPQVASSGTLFSFFVTGSSTAIAAGKRIRIRIFLDDSEIGPIPNAVGYRVRTNGATTYGSRFIFPVTLVEQIVLEQESFRFRNDDGSETTATWKAALNTTPTTLLVDAPFRLRFGIDDLGGPTFTDDFRLQFRRNPFGGSYGPWTAVGAGAYVAPYDSPNFASGAATTQQITGGTFKAGSCFESGTFIATADLTSGDHTEIEASLMVSSANGALDLDTYEFRLVKATVSAVLATYTQTPAVTVSVVSGNTYTKAGYGKESG
jgi:hypothetical protein